MKCFKTNKAIQENILSFIWKDYNLGYEFFLVKVVKFNECFFLNQFSYSEQL